MKQGKIILSLAALGGLILVARSMNGRSIPDGLTAVKPFDQSKYLGTWYEIARFDFRYERNLNNVSATYTLKDNGTIRVDNKGYNYKSQKWKESIGKAKPSGDPTEARLKVSFFGPFYAAYNVVALDKDYKYALVAGKNTDYLWLLSREKTMPEDVKNKYLDIARKAGYKVDELVWVKQDR